MSDEKQKSIGALWENQSSKGKYFTGQLEIDEKKIKIVVFANGFKKEDKHPDWKIYVSVPRDQQSSQNYDNSASSSETRTGTFYDKPAEEGADPDLPF
jgi:hypothetical protein